MSAKIKIIICLCGAIAVVAITFLGQQRSYSKVFSQTLIPGLTNKTETALLEGTNWMMANIFPKIGEEAQNGGETVKNSIGSIGNVVEQTKQNISEKISETQTKVSDYFSGIKNSIVNPAANKNCDCQCQTPVPTTAPVN